MHRADGAWWSFWGVVELGSAWPQRAAPGLCMSPRPVSMRASTWESGQRSGSERTTQASAAATAARNFHG